MNTSQFPTRQELKTLMKAKKIPGLSLAIIENAESVFHLELGVKNSQTKELVDEDTLFESASDFNRHK